jgi:hypothetical protein
VEKASGVFLWVYVVVSTLLDALVSGDRLEQLVQKLDELPPELDALFNRILDQIELKYASEASELFQFVCANDSNDSTLLSLYWSQLNLEEVLACPISVMSESEIKYRAEIMKRNVVSRCKCLLDSGRSATPITKVTWTHRTVREYVKQASVWKRIRDLSPQYDPIRALWLSVLRQAKARVTTHGRVLEDLRIALQDAFANSEVFETALDRLQFGKEVGRVAAKMLARPGQILKNDNDIYWLPKPHQIMHHENMTTFHKAMELEYDWFVRDQIQSDHSILDAPVFQAFQIDALMLASGCGWYDMQVICLQNGSNPRKVSPHDVRLPKLIFDQKTAWQMALDFIAQREGADAKIWSQTIRSCAEFLRQGADPYALLVDGRSAQIILNYVLENLHDEDDPEDIRILKKSTRKRSEWSERHRKTIIRS